MLPVSIQLFRDYELSYLPFSCWIYLVGLLYLTLGWMCLLQSLLLSHYFISYVIGLNGECLVIFLWFSN